jgi:hypothetical protein
MALVSGRYASFKYSTGTGGSVAPNTMNFIGSWDLTISMDTMDATYFGSAWKAQKVGMGSWNASLTGYLDITTQSSYHNQIIDDALEGRLLQWVWLHEGPTSSGNFWAPNASSTFGGVNYSTDAGCYISNLKVSASKDAITTMSFDLIGNGSIIYMNGTTASYLVLAESTVV